MGHIGNKRRRDVNDDEVVAAYRRTHSVYRVARDFGIGATTIYRVLERRHIRRDGLKRYRQQAQRFSLQRGRVIRRAYEKGASFADLVVRYGGTEYSVKKAIQRSGGRLVSVCPPCSPSEEGRLLMLYREGRSQMKVSLILGRSQSFISRVLRRHDVVRKSPTGSAHPHWKGGRWQSSGYIQAHVDSSDQMSVMRNNSGYVLEHRLVMARQLGRPLLPTETVHHVNGVRDDNRPENLQLRVGRHGKGTALRCLDCGSQNIGPQPLEVAG